MVIDGPVRDFRIDQGRLVSVASDSLVLLERDGSEQTIPIAASTEVWLGEQLLGPSALVPRMNVLTIREGDQPAQSVRAGTTRLPGRGQ
jgi:hypothetical protein